MSVKFDLTGRIDGTLPVLNVHETSVILSINGDWSEALETMMGETIDVVIRKHRKKRSINANALCWEICTQIGNAMRPPVPKEDVYRSAIKDVGEYTALSIRSDAVDAFDRVWSTKGTGWFTEIMDDSWEHGKVVVFAYAGSSTYDTKQMSRLIDYLVDQARQMELPIAWSLQEIDRIKEQWKGVTP